MKKMLISGICLIFLIGTIPVILENSEAKLPTKYDWGDAEVFMHAIVYNSDNQIVGYVESGPQAWYPGTFAIWLKNNGAERTEITRDGNQYEVLTLKDGGNWNRNTSFGAWFFNFPVDGVMRQLIYFHIDSFVVEPGDRVEIYYTLIKQLTFN